MVSTLSAKNKISNATLNQAEERKQYKNPRPNPKIEPYPLFNLCEKNLKAGNLVVFVSYFFCSTHSSWSCRPGKSNNCNDHSQDEQTKIIHSEGKRVAQNFSSEWNMSILRGCTRNKWMLFVSNYGIEWKYIHAPKIAQASTITLNCILNIKYLRQSFDAVWQSKNLIYGL